MSLDIRVEKLGLSAKIITKIAITIVVTIIEAEIAIVVITSPSSVLALTFAFSMALIAQGILRFIMLPVTNERYVPPAPSIGE